MIQACMLILHELLDGLRAVSTAAEKCAEWRRESVPVGLREKGRKALEFGIAARIEARGA
jgi:hypothetical protein